MEQAGGFDEGYWMYWEDADLCRRLAEADWAVHYEPDAVVHHATGASGTSERTIRAFHDSAARFASQVDRPLAASRRSSTGGCSRSAAASRFEAFGDPRATQ